MARRTRKASEDQLAFNFDALWVEPEAERLEADTDEQVRAMLRRQWEVADPMFVQSLNDPTAHFSQLGE
ncbi:hypothetical protein [Brachybacterium alimentarium]|uniref:hypothetical protein n=1 Tax=Brachybacterium alimentarium TaxID=47845 RepID=UPI003FD0B848